MCSFSFGPNDRSSECAIASFARSANVPLNSSLTRSRHANGTCEGRSIRANVGVELKGVRSG
eukprot:29806-Pelagococcus_subviridis.AAC.2